MNLSWIKFLFIFIIYIKKNGCLCEISDDELDTIAIYYNSPLHVSEQLIESNTTLASFVSEYPTKVIIHGYIANRFHGSIEPIKNAYLGRGDVNLIMVDWDQLAWKLYDESRSFVQKVGYRVGRLLLNYVRNQNVDLTRLHIIGHSLGAHIAGNVGRYFNGKVSRITGLDPAAPLFTNCSTDAIRNTDGQFVDIIHTCGHALGEIWPRGHIDFYPNSGIPHQPGCHVNDVLTLFSCSHFRAPLYFAESILYPDSFLATNCTLNEILGDAQNKCNNPSETSLMGDSVAMGARGIYYLTTNEMYPFGRGNYSQYGIW